MSRFLLVTSDPSFDKSFRAAVENRIPGDVQTVFSAALPGTPNELLSKSIGEIPSVVVLGPGVGRARALGLAGVFDIQRPEISLVLVDQEGQDAASALRAGFYDVLDATAEPESILAVLTRAVDVAQSRRRNIGSTTQESFGATGGANSKSRVIVVTSPKGGVGKTCTAVNLAVGLGKVDPMDVVLVDLDVQFGDVAPMLRMDPEHTLNDAVVGPATEDSLVLKTFLSVHPSSIYALCAPADPADGDSINGLQINHLLEQLTSQFKYVVVDTAAGLGERTLAALQAATDAVFVVGMDVPGVRAMRKQIDLLGQLGMVPNSVKVVVNGAERKTGLSVADIEETIKTPVDFVVPDSKMAVYSVNRGEPLLLLDPRDKASARIQDLVKSFDPAAQAPAKGNHRKALV